MIQSIIVLVAFLACVGVVMAVWMVLRDLWSRRFNVADRRLTLDAKPSDIRRFIREQEVHRGPIDEPFFRLVEQSGTKLDAPTVIALVLGMGIIGAAIPFVVWENLLGAAVGLLVGCLIPIVWLSIKRWRRIRAMRNLMPEALQIVADCVRAGHNLEEASELAAAENREPLREEFKEAASQLKLGNAPAAVMQNMARRIPLPEFRVFATAVMVHQKAGGNLALLTERLSRAALQRQEFNGHVNAVTAGSRLSAIGMIIGAVAAVLVLAWLQPTYVRTFLTNEAGPYLVGAAATLQIIGAFWVWRISKVSY